jgi:hypothetical protein
MTFVITLIWQHQSQIYKIKLKFRDIYLEIYKDSKLFLVNLQNGNYYLFKNS